MGSIIPMILSAVVGQMFEKNNPNNGKQNSAFQAQLEEIRKREQINATDRRQKYKSLLASERARLAGSGISSNSGLAGSVLSGLLKRQKQETKDSKAHHFRPISSGCFHHNGMKGFGQGRGFVDNILKGFVGSADIC